MNKTKIIKIAREIEICADQIEKNKELMREKLAEIEKIIATMTREEIEKVDEDEYLGKLLEKIYNKL